MIAPVVLATFMEHIGDVTTNGTVVGKNFIENPGLNRTLLGDGLATIFAGFAGGPANTTYGENTALLAITKNYDPRVLELTAVFAIVLSCVGKFGGFLQSIPQAVMGGISIYLFSMITYVAVSYTHLPAKWTYENIDDMKNQLKLLGLSYDWERELATSNPDYYKFTQEIFLKFLEAGLAYKKKSFVNWCPSCETVLANEQVVGGQCERCDAVVEMCIRDRSCSWSFFHKICGTSLDIAFCLSNLAFLLKYKLYPIHSVECSKSIVDISISFKISCSKLNFSFGFSIT